MTITFNKILIRLSKISLLEKLFYSFTVAILIIIIINYNKPLYEGLNESKEFITKTNNNIYDDFYVSIYDDLVFSKNKNDYEITEIINKTAPNKNSKFLDIGSGTGHHVSSIDAHGYNVVGVDKSDAMIKKSQQTYPKLNFKREDVLNSMAFTPNSFTHITCLYFTIYYIKEKQMFFNNCMNWLMPGGYLLLHLVDRDNFDPILPAGDPFIIVSPQKYASKRITNTTVNFNNMNYKSNFEFKPEKNESILKETIKFKNGNVRQHEHKLYMPTQKEILTMAKDLGFKLTGKIDLLNIHYQHQYIYVLQKPNF